MTNSRRGVKRGQHTLMLEFRSYVLQLSAARNDLPDCTIPNENNALGHPTRLRRARDQHVSGNCCVDKARSGAPIHPRRPGEIPDLLPMIKPITSRARAGATTSLCPTPELESLLIAPYLYHRPAPIPIWTDPVCICKTR